MHKIPHCASESFNCNSSIKFIIHLLSRDNIGRDWDRHPFPFFDNIGTKLKKEGIYLNPFRNPVNTPNDDQS